MALFLSPIIIYACSPQRNTLPKMKEGLLFFAVYIHTCIYRTYTEICLNRLFSLFTVGYWNIKHGDDSNHIFLFTMGETDDSTVWQLLGSFLHLWLCSLGNKNICLHVVHVLEYKEIVKGTMRWSSEIILGTEKMAVIFILWECERLTSHTFMSSPSLWQVHGYSGMYL